MSDPVLIAIDMQDPPTFIGTYFVWNFEGMREECDHGEFIEVSQADSFTNRGGDLDYKQGPVLWINPRYIRSFWKVK